MSEPVFIHIHSPLVGPYTWSLVAEVLRARGYICLVPRLDDTEASPLAYWKQHVDSVVAAVTVTTPPDQPLYLVGHSGAGMLLPVIGRSLPNPIIAMIFVDAGIPIDGASRLDLLKRELPEIAGPIEEALQEGQSLPQWTADDLQEELPDLASRQQLLQELHPRSLPFFTEPLPVPADWPDHPCFYVQFTDGYDYSAADAHSRGWEVRRINSGHFHLLVDPTAVADVLLELIGKNAA